MIVADQNLIPGGCKNDRRRSKTDHRGVLNCPLGPDNPDGFPFSTPEPKNKDGAKNQEKNNQE